MGITEIDQLQIDGYELKAYIRIKGYTQRQFCRELDTELRAACDDDDDEEKLPWGRFSLYLNEHRCMPKELVYRVADKLNIDVELFLKKEGQAKLDLKQEMLEKLIDMSRKYGANVVPDSDYFMAVRTLLPYFIPKVYGQSGFDVEAFAAIIRAAQEGNAPDEMPDAEQEVLSEIV